jgi:hypothetical protein
VFTVFEIIHTAWSGVMGYTFSLDIATVVMIGKGTLVGMDR